MLFVGSLFNRRRLPQLIAAFAQATADLPAARLVDRRLEPHLAAPGSRGHRREHGVADRVDVRSYVDDGELGGSLRPGVGVRVPVRVRRLRTDAARSARGGRSDPRPRHAGRARGLRTRRDVRAGGRERGGDVRAPSRARWNGEPGSPRRCQHAPAVLARYSWDDAAERTLAGIERVARAPGRTIPSAKPPMIITRRSCRSSSSASTRAAIWSAVSPRWWPVPPRSRTRSSSWTTRRATAVSSAVRRRWPSMRVITQAATADSPSPTTSASAPRLAAGPAAQQRLRRAGGSYRSADRAPARASRRGRRRAAARRRQRPDGAVVRTDDLAVAELRQKVIGRAYERNLAPAVRWLNRASAGERLRRLGQRRGAARLSRGCRGRRSARRALLPLHRGRRLLRRDPGARPQDPVHPSRGDHPPARTLARDGPRRHERRLPAQSPGVLREAPSLLGAAAADLSAPQGGAAAGA